MAQALYHPDHGYYTNAKPLGAAGDFTTAPEISQMFGELIGLSLAQCWLDQGAPTPFCLAELGPGSGQLMSDILRATKSVPNFHAAMRLHLCEVNPNLKSEQATRLPDPTWVTDTTDLPDLPLFLIANEFFDCLPINQYVARDDGWDETIIAATDGALTFARRPAGAVETELPDSPAGTIIELSPAANAIAQDIAASIAENGGCALIFDYGNTGGGDTLQALQNHTKVDPLHDIGQSDLTAHVNFAALRDAITGVQTTGPEPQGAFLERLGITPRAQQLASSLTDDALETHIAAHRRLTHPDEMGQLFKAFAITPLGAPTPAGFPQ
jgi:SAM-dependent MidA family methyltransferase